MKLEDGNLIYCASCHRQDLELKHVDFEAAYDGPVINEPHYRYQIDDLIICEQCLREAGKLIHLYQAEDIKQENKELGEALEVKLNEIEALHEIISDLEKSLEHITDKKIQRPSRPARLVDAVMLNE